MFMLDQSMYCIVHLKLYHTIPSFGDIEKDGFCKTLWEKETMLLLYMYVVNVTFLY